MKLNLAEGPKLQLKPEKATEQLILASDWTCRANKQFPCFSYAEQSQTAALLLRVEPWLSLVSTCIISNAYCQ